MTDYTDEQKAEIKKIVENATRLNDWTNMEDSLRRILRVTVAQQVAAGILHPFAKEVAESMYSVAITGRNFTPVQEQKDEVPKQD